ncbi:MAG: DUF3494 domain-containing protein [Pseudomonadota bacterium]
MKATKWILPLVSLLAYGPMQAFAIPLLGSKLASFAVLGASTVTNVPTSKVVGNVGVWSSGGANAVTGFNSSPGVAVADAQVTAGKLHAGTDIAHLAQSQLIDSITSLGFMGTGITLANPDLSGLTLAPGVYTVHAGTSNLSTLFGALTLDGKGNANAAWVFQMDSTLITSPGSKVNVINTGSKAGVFWDVRSSATLDTGTSFEGNILALTSITLNNGASIGCGRALASTGAVTMNMNSIGADCDTRASGGDSFGGGIIVPEKGGKPGTLPFASVPEPNTFMLFGLGLMGLVACRRTSFRLRSSKQAAQLILG